MTTLNLGHVSIFYQVIFPVNKQGSIERPPRKQSLKNDAKEREKNNCSKKTISRPRGDSPILDPIRTRHCHVKHSAPRNDFFWSGKVIGPYLR